jgi:hypothetical protein
LFYTAVAAGRRINMGKEPSELIHLLTPVFGRYVKGLLPCPARMYIGRFAYRYDSIPISFKGRNHYM